MLNDKEHRELMRLSAKCAASTATGKDVTRLLVLRRKERIERKADALLARIK